MGKLHVIDHPLIQHKLTIMRDKRTGPKDFRELLEEITVLMGYEVTRDFPLDDYEIETPMTKMTAKRISGKKVAIAGIAAAAVISSAGCRKEGFRPGENGTGVSDGSLIPATSEALLSTGEFLEIQGDIAYPSCGRVEGIFSGSPHAEGAQVPDIGELMSSRPEAVRKRLSGFRFDEVTEAWKQYVCDCFVENGAGFLYDGFEVHVYRNADGYVDIFEVITG